MQKGGHCWRQLLLRFPLHWIRLQSPSARRPRQLVVTMSTSEPRASYLKVFWVRPWPTCFTLPATSVMFIYDNVSPLQYSTYSDWIAHLVVSDNRLKSIATSSDDFLNNVSEVVNQEVQCLSVLSDRAELWAYKSVHCANNLAYQIRNVSDQADEKRVEI
jgi:hypothetical protein